MNTTENRGPEIPSPYKFMELRGYLGRIENAKERIYETWKSNLDRVYHAPGISKVWADQGKNEYIKLNLLPDIPLLDSEDLERLSVKHLRSVGKIFSWARDETVKRGTSDFSGPGETIFDSPRTPEEREYEIALKTEIRKILNFSGKNIISPRTTDGITFVRIFEYKDVVDLFLSDTLEILDTLEEVIDEVKTKFRGHEVHKVP